MRLIRTGGEIKHGRLDARVHGVDRGLAGGSVRAGCAYAHCRAAHPGPDQHALCAPHAAPHLHASRHPH